VPAVRPAGIADLPTIERIVHDAYAGYIEQIGKPPGPMLDDYRRHIRAHEAWVATDGEAIVGVLVLLPKENHLLLDNIAVRPALHKRGIGRLLIDFAEMEAARRGYDEVRLYTHQAMHENIAMYPHLGYDETGRGEEAGFQRVFFRKRMAGGVPR
jgi:GNAT superfamily N-acetyltransferase